MRELLQGLRLEIEGLVLPTGCAGCGRPLVRDRLCEACQEVLRGPVPRRVWPSSLPAGLPRVHGSLVYRDEARAVLLAHKERGVLCLSGLLGELLARSVSAALRGARPGEVALVPVPSSRRSVRRRGHDPTLRIARSAVRQLTLQGKPARVLPVLRQCRPVTDQAGLSAPERMTNLRGALVACPGSARLFAGRRVVLVDDLLTTGASLVEAARAMRAEQDRAMRSGEARRQTETDGPGGEASLVAAVLAVRG